MKRVIKYIKLIIIFLFIFSITKVNIKKDNGMIYNNNKNKTLDLTAMAIKIDEIRLMDLYYPLDTYVGNLTGYVADCPLCSGKLGCTGQNVLDGTIYYNDKDYGNVRILASSSSLACGSIVRYNLNEQETTAIVLDRGVNGTNLDLLVDDVSDAYSIGRKNVTYDILRFGWSRSNS